MRSPERVAIGASGVISFVRTCSGAMSPGSRNEPLLGQPRAAARMREAEVREIGAALRVQQDVLGLDVPVDDALRVGEIESARDLAEDVGGLGNRGTPVECVSAEGGPLDQLHRRKR